MNHVLTAIALLAFPVAAAAAQDEPPPPPELVQAGEAWSECLSSGIEGAPSRQSPRDTARAILARCRDLQTRMVQAHHRWVDSTALSDAQKREAHDAVERSLTGLEAQISQAVQASRADD